MSDAHLPPGQFRYDVFVSHAPTERWALDWLLPRLEHAGLAVYVDRRDAPIGRPRIINREQAVEQSRHTLVVLTPRYLAGEWSTFEALLAQSADPSGLRQRLLPLVLEPCALPARIAQLEPADFTDPAGWEAELARLIRALGADERAPGAAPRPAQPAPADGRLDYERGLRALARFVPPSGADWDDFELYRAQLLENLRDDRRFGASDTLRSDRARLIDKLNQLARRLAGLSFVDLSLGQLP